MALSFLSNGSHVVRASIARGTRAMSLSLKEVDHSLAPSLRHDKPYFGNVQVSTTANGVTVVSEGNASPTSKVTVVVAAGSRNEGVDNVGVSHVLRQLAFQSANDRSALAMRRHNDAVGAQVSCGGDREVISYSAQFLKKDLSTVMGNLSAATSNQALKSWEVNEGKAHLASLLGNMPSKPVVLDALHAGAFRTTLGNSTSVAPYNLGGITPAVLSSYIDDYFTGGNMTVVGAGVDHRELVDMVEANFAHIAAKDVTAATASYKGGFESRVGSGASDADVAVAFEGVARGAEGQIASMVLQRVIGGSPVVKYGDISASDSVKKVSASIEALNFNYNDTGLFGIYVKSAGASAGAAVTEAVTALKSVLAGGFTDADVTRAKSQLMRSVLDMSPSERADFYAGQVLATKQPLTPEDFAAHVSAITTADVKAVATKIGASKPVVSSAGNVAYVPYASELGL